MAESSCFLCLEPYFFSLEHTGPSSNTYEKIAHDTPKKLEQNQIVSLSAELHLEIVDVQNSFNSQKLQPNQIEFAQDLFNLANSYNVEIIGVQKSHLAKLYRQAGNASSSKVTWDSEFNFGVPYLKVELNCTNPQKKQK